MEQRTWGANLNRKLVNRRTSLMAPEGREMMRSRRALWRAAEPDEQQKEENESRCQRRIKPPFEIDGLGGAISLLLDWDLLLVDGRVTC